MKNIILLKTGCFLSSADCIQALHGKWLLIISKFAWSDFGALDTNTYYCKHMIKGPWQFVRCHAVVARGKCWLSSACPFSCWARQICSTTPSFPCHPSNYLFPHLSTLHGVHDCNIPQYLKSRYCMLQNSDCILQKTESHWVVTTSEQDVGWDTSHCPFQGELSVSNRTKSLESKPSNKLAWHKVQDISLIGVANKPEEYLS